jgi:carboxymethylenebutenolidase
MTLARSLAALGLMALAGCQMKHTAQSADDHAGHDKDGTPVSAMAGHDMGAMQDASLPAGATDAKARLASSSRHGEWVKIAWEPGSADSLMAWVVYPEKKKNAPVVVVIHEIFGLSTWVRGVADQLAADGYIAVAPDLISAKRGGPSVDELASDSAVKLIRSVSTDEMNKGVAAAGRYGMSLPAAMKKYGVVGYCWGGSASFNHAVFNPPGLGAAVVYYGTTPKAEALASVKVPVLGLYGENDQRVNATIPLADSAFKAMGKVYEKEIFAGAGHGFLRAQDGANGANLSATKAAWPRTIAWFRKHLGA